MATMRTRRGRLPIAIVLAGLVATPVFAKPAFQGTFGTETVKMKKRFANCAYLRAVGLLSIGAAKGNRKKQTGATVAGRTVDPTAPGAVFPMVVTDPTGTFTSGRPPTPPTWATYGGGIVITLTGYTKGKLSGTATGTMAAISITGATGDIAVDASFTVKCAAQ
jgi:hypothetical protein